MSEEKQQTIAEELSAARQTRGLDLEEAQRQSGISLAVLQGLEADQFEVVEPVFARMALQAYAEFLGLDPEPLLARFDQQQAQNFRPRPAVVLSQPTPQRRSRTPLIAISSVVGVCCLLAVAYYFFDGSMFASPQAPAQSEVSTQTDAPPTEPQPAAALDDSLLVQSSTEPDMAETAAADTAATAAAAQTTEFTPVVLELEARDSTWVQIGWDNAGEKFEGVVPPGQRRRFEARDHFVVLSTRPHGMSYWLDGQLLGGGQLGDPNQVLRFRATADGIKLLGPNLQPLIEEAPDAQP
jgi:cytoskeletal protein RodZ